MEIKKEALKLADELEEYCKQDGYLHNDYVDMIRKLVAELDKQKEEFWQKGFAQGKSSKVNQFINDECDKLIQEKHGV